MNAKMLTIDVDLDYIRGSCRLPIFMGNDIFPLQFSVVVIFHGCTNLPMTEGMGRILLHRDLKQYFCIVYMRNNPFLISINLFKGN